MATAGVAAMAQTVAAMKVPLVKVAKEAQLASADLGAEVVTGTAVGVVATVALSLSLIPQAMIPVTFQLLPQEALAVALELVEVAVSEGM